MTMKHISLLPSLVVALGGSLTSIDGVAAALVESPHGRPPLLRAQHPGTSLQEQKHAAEEETVDAVRTRRDMLRALSETIPSVGSFSYGAVESSDGTTFSFSFGTGDAIDSDAFSFSMPNVDPIEAHIGSFSYPGVLVATGSDGGTTAEGGETTTNGSSNNESEHGHPIIDDEGNGQSGTDIQNDKGTTPAQDAAVSDVQTLDRAGDADNLSQGTAILIVVVGIVAALAAAAAMLALWKMKHSSPTTGWSLMDSDQASAFSNSAF